MGTMRQERQRYFEANGFGKDGGYNDRWIAVKAGPLTFAMPNSPARKKAGPFHDLHHILTGYGTDWIGEAEIAAWELASGCKRMVAAWILNLLAMGMKVLLSPLRVYRAFIRGRQSRNLYGEKLETLLDLPTEEVRELMGTAGNPLPPTGKDRLVFIGFSTVALAMLLGPIGTLGWLVWLWLA
jgi:hypothetical protein